MKTYTVRFCFRTDNRCEAVVKACNAMQALALALVECRLEDWADSEGFNIEILSGDHR